MLRLWAQATSKCIKAIPIEMLNRWVEFATAPDQLTAETWAGLIRNEGCPCAVKSDSIPFLGLSVMPVRLMAPEDRVEEAQAVLDRFFGDTGGC